MSSNQCYTLFFSMQRGTLSRYLSVSHRLTQISSYSVRSASMGSIEAARIAGM